MQAPRNRSVGISSRAGRGHQAQFQRGLALQKAGRLAEAVASYTAAIGLEPGDPAAFHNMAAALLATGRPQEAIAAWQRALQLRPDALETVIALGQALLDAERADEAAILLSSASQHHPADARILSLNGRALLALGRVGPAIGALFMALDVDPGNAQAHDGLANALFDSGELDQALALSAEAFRLAPTYRHAVSLTRVLLGLGRYADALMMTDQAHSLQPGSLAALANRAAALQGLGRYEEAEIAGRQAVAASPTDAMAGHHLGMILLALGQLTAEAWVLFECRRHLKGRRALPSAMPRWTGEDIAGRTILLHAEEGLGDTLQFVRYAPLVADRAGRVILVVQAPLARLLRIVPGVDEVVAIGAPLPPHDVICPLLSLPGIFGTTLATIPPPLPYEPVDPGPSDPGPIPGSGLRVGLVWAGNVGFAGDRLRSLPVAALAALAGIAGVQFYGLQLHGAAPTVLPPELGAIDLMAGVQDFADTARLVAGLDLVISVDTAVAHLAATMGKPVWLMSRFPGCWRWLHDRADSPWYPTLRVVRQDSPNDWSAVIERVRGELVALAAERGSDACEAPRIAPAHHACLCKACATPAVILGAVDFNRSCEDRNRGAAAPSGRRVTYHRCPACALVFTADFDTWTREDFRTQIYNDGYAAVDPGYATERPANCAALIGSLFGEACRGLAVLDYGGGHGALAALLTAEHGMTATVYDPFNPAFDVPPRGVFPLVTCFEVLEHTPEPRATIAELAAYAGLEGIVVFSTLLQPAGFDALGLDWWYAAPRNGHVTLYSAQALVLLWHAAGFKLASLGPDLHIAFRSAPKFAPWIAGLPIIPHSM
jgi:tetratricopeptide (TPR) repeat protein